MSMKEVMSELGLSRDAIYRRINQGLLTPLPKENPNRRIEALRFARADVEALKSAPPPKPTPTPPTPTTHSE